MLAMSVQVAFANAATHGHHTDPTYHSVMTLPVDTGPAPVKRVLAVCKSLQDFLGVEAARTLQSSMQEILNYTRLIGITDYSDIADILTHDDNNISDKSARKEIGEFFDTYYSQPFEPLEVTMSVPDAAFWTQAFLNYVSGLRELEILTLEDDNFIAPHNNKILAYREFFKPLHESLPCIGLPMSPTKPA